MLLAIVAIGKKYIDNIQIYLPKYIENGWDIRILTDDCDAFPTFKTYKYQNKIFSYIDKLLFRFFPNSNLGSDKDFLLYAIQIKKNPFLHTNLYKCLNKNHFKPLIIHDVNTPVFYHR